MPFDRLEDRAGGKDRLLPMHIAHNSLLTAREKIELLNRMKADATGALEEGRDLGYDPAEIDEAIEVVRQGVQEGVGTQTVLKGDF